MLELIATREIAKGEEVFMNFGPEWSEAWEKRVRTMSHKSCEYKTKKRNFIRIRIIYKRHAFKSMAIRR